eukprot:gene22807-1372_t
MPVYNITPKTPTRAPSPPTPDANEDPATMKELKLSDQELNAVL